MGKSRNKLSGDILWERKNREKLDSLLISQLEIVLETLKSDNIDLKGSFISSPLEPLLQRLVDELLLISTLFQEGELFSSSVNPELLFKENVRAGHAGIDSKIKYVNSPMPNMAQTWDLDEQLYASDPLGNPKQISRVERSRFQAWSPGLSDDFSDLALWVQGLIRGYRDDFSFMEKFVRRSSNLRPLSPSKQSARKYYKMRKRGSH